MICYCYKNIPTDIQNKQNHKNIPTDIQNKQNHKNIPTDHRHLFLVIFFYLDTVYILQGM